MSPYFGIPNLPTIKVIKTSKKTIDHKFIKSGCTLLICFYSNLLASTCKNQRSTPHHGTPPHPTPPHPAAAAAAEIQNRSPPVVQFFFACADPTPKMHGQRQMLSTPGVRDCSCRYRIICARHQMHGNL